MTYMRYQKFIETVKEHIKQELQKPVNIYPVLKNNGTIYDGMVIMDPMFNISPTIYLNPYYHRYLDGVSMEDIYEDILKVYEKNSPKDDFDISIFNDYSKACSIKKILKSSAWHREKTLCLLNHCNRNSIAGL